MVQQKYRYPIKKACRTLRISWSGFYAYCAREPYDRQLENEFLSHKIREVFEQHSGRYGAKWIAYALKDEEIKVNRKRIVKLMHAMDLYAKGARRAYNNYNKKYSNRAYLNALQQDFTVDHRNKAWLVDITYVPRQEGYLYLAVFLDLSTRKIVGWSIAATMTERLSMDAFLQCLGKEQSVPELIVHTDQGSQFTSGNFTTLLKSKGAIPSNSNKGNPYDNALMKSFYKTLKREFVNNAGFKTKDEAHQALVSYIELVLLQQY